MIKNKPYFLQRNTAIATVCWVLTMCQALCVHFVIMFIALMSNWKFGDVKSGQPGLELAWLTPKPPWTPLPSMASHQLPKHRANLSVKEGLAQGVECEGDLAVNLPHHWLPGPIRLMWWPGVSFLPHLCVHQALSCRLLQQEWPSLIKKDSSTVGPGSASFA